MFEFLYRRCQNKRYERSLKIILALTAALFLLIFSQSAAALPEHLCANKKVERVNTPLHVVNKGKLVSLVGRSLRKPVRYKNGTVYGVDLLPAPADVYQFPYPGELYVMDTKAGKRIVHNHHVFTDGRYSPDANGWWVVDIEPSGVSKAMGFNNSECFFRYIYTTEHK